MANDEKQRFDITGLDLNRPVDSTKPGKLPYLKNARTYTGGTLGARLGITDLGEVVAGQSPVHSIRRLNDPLNATWTRTIGTGTYLAVGQSYPFTQLDSGYSGDPLALVPWSPQDAPYSFMYIGDRSRMRKTATTARLHTVGWAAPNTPPGVTLASTPSYKVVDSFQATTGWGQAGTAGAPSLESGASGRVNTTILYVLYDTGSTGWACVAPTSQANINQGVRLIVNSAETVTVQQIYAGAPASTTIASIIYDSGTSGLASLVLTSAIDLSIADILIRNSTVGPENARVLSATRGPGGTTSLRLSTSGTWAAANTVQLLPTFRAYFTTTVANGQGIVESFVRTVVATGTGTLSKTVVDPITGTSPLNLSLITTTVPSSPEDYMHITMRVSDPAVITELKVLLDVDIAGAAAPTVFTSNYYWRSFRASDLTPAASNLQSLLSVRTAILQRNVIDTPPVPPELQQFFQNNIPIEWLIQYGGLDPATTQALIDYQNSVVEAQQAAQQNQTIELAELDTAISQQMNAGVSQWVELRFRLSDLIRVGSDFSRTLANVAAIRIVAIVTGSVNLDLDSWWVGGGYGPDTGDVAASAYFYRYRAREILTNVPSNFSPASRYIANPLRQSVVVTPTQYTPVTGTSLSASDFVLDIERFGGLLPEWRYVGTTPNASTPSFTDVYPDDIVASNPKYGNSNFQPWPVIGIPATGTTASAGVSGTTVVDTGTNFSTMWAPGNTILINGVPYTIYRVLVTTPGSTASSRLELVENAGTQSSPVSWRINAPTLLAQPLPCLWQWDNRFFACGDTVNAGRLYFSNADSETTIESNYLDVTAPSEPLMNGVQYNVRSFLWSSENFMQILPTGNLAIPYQVQQIPGGKGLFSRWAVTLTPSPVLCALGKDGIYATIGGSPTSLTDPDLYPLFPHEGNTGSDTNGVSAPATDTPALLRLHYYDDYLYFDYKINSVDISSGCPTGTLQVGVPYSFQLTATGGLTPYIWSISSGALPTGLTLDADTGIISGTPTTAGTFNYDIRATDSSSPAQTDTDTCSLTVTEVAISSGCPTDDPELGVLYEFQLTATGGTAPYTWSISDGELPDGLTLNPTSGVISGTPINGGTFAYDITVTDSAVPPQTATDSCSLTVSGAFAYYSDFVVQAAQVPSPQSNYPVGIIWADPRFESVAEGGHVRSANGYDLRPYDSTGTTPLTYELVWYDDATGAFEMWVLMSSIDVASRVRMKYGSTTITTDGSSTATWPSSYNGGVYHYGSPTSLSLEDSTSNNNDGTGVNGPTAADGFFNNPAMQVGGAVELVPASSQAVIIPDIPNLRVSNTDTATWEFWIYRADTLQPTQVLQSKSGNSPTYTGWIFYLFNNLIHARLCADFGAGDQVTSNIFTFAILGGWSYFVITWDGSAWGIWRNDTQPSLNTSGTLSSSSSSTADLDLGRHAADGAYLNGRLDEARMSKGIVRSQDYKLTSWNNQSNMGTTASPGFWELEAEVPT